MAIDYKKAGVDIDKANDLVGAFKRSAARSLRPGVMGSIGGFGAFFDPKRMRLKDPLLVSSCDGVGTKLKIAIMNRIHDTVGIDLVAMSVNDVLCSGAEPLFFLDYIATAKIDAPVLEAVVRGIAEGCRQANCALVGGETAEMPGMYKAGDYDLAGFCVGAVERTKVLGASRVSLGDAVIGLASSGIHSNGFSLVRKLFSPQELHARARDLLVPTRIYVRPVLNAIRKFNDKGFGIKALAHITGGAFYDKAARIVPGNMTLVLYKNAWPRPPIFDELQHLSKLDDVGMHHTFNMGLGMVMVVADKVKMDVVRALAKAKIESFIVGEMVGGVGGVAVA